MDLEKFCELSQLPCVQEMSSHTDKEVMKGYIFPKEVRGGRDDKIWEALWKGLCHTYILCTVTCYSFLARSNLISFQSAFSYAETLLNCNLITTQRLKNDLFLLSWCSVNVQSACNPYCILQSRAIACHLQEACQNPPLCIVSEPGNLNMYCCLSNFPKCCYVFWAMVRLCLYLPQPWAWEHGKKRGKIIMGKKNRRKMFALETASIGIQSDFKAGVRVCPQPLHMGTQMPVKVDSSWAGWSFLVKSLWRQIEERRKGERKKRWQM